MLGEDFDQTTDMVYEVWNWNQDGDPLMGVFEDKGTAGEFGMEQTIETGGGILSYYPPINRYTELNARERARHLLSEVALRLEDIEAELGDDHIVDTEPIYILEPREFPIRTVDLEYDREAFQMIIDNIAWSDTALDIARVYRTLARIRHLGVYDEGMVLTCELNFRDLFEEVNDPP